MHALKRISPPLIGLLFLGACDRTPEPPPTPTPQVVTPAAQAAGEVPVPESQPVLVAPQPPAKMAKPSPSPLPAGFVRILAGEAGGADGRRRQIPAFAIAYQPVTVAELRQWAESGGRRLPQLGGETEAATATDLDWMAADAYARWLSERDHRRYRLPGEMEWLRAAQSGRIATQAQRQPSEPPLWEWTDDCWGETDADPAETSTQRCASRVLVGGEMAAAGNWGRAPMGERRPAASFRLVLELP